MKTLVIAHFTFREAPRRRMIWGVLLLSFVFVGMYYWGYTAVRADFTPEGAITTFDFVSMILVGLGFYTINFLAGVMTIFAAVGTVAGEIESGTFQAIITKPLARWELILGKFLGFAGMIAVYIAAMTAAVLATARRVGEYTPPKWPLAIGLVILVSLILLALTIFGSTVLQTMANGVVVFMLYGGALLGGPADTLATVAGDVLAGREEVSQHYRQLDRHGRRDRPRAGLPRDLARLPPPARSSLAMSSQERPAGEGRTQPRTARA